MFFVGCPCCPDRRTVLMNLFQLSNSDGAFVRQAEFGCGPGATPTLYIGQFSRQYADGSLAMLIQRSFTRQIARVGIDLAEARWRHDPTSQPSAPSQAGVPKYQTFAINPDNDHLAYTAAGKLVGLDEEGTVMWTHDIALGGDPQVANIHPYLDGDFILSFNGRVIQRRRFSTGDIVWENEYPFEDPQREIAGWVADGTIFVSASIPLELELLDPDGELINRVRPDFTSYLQIEFDRQDDCVYVMTSTFPAGLTVARYSIEGETPFLSLDETWKNSQPSIQTPYMALPPDGSGILLAGRRPVFGVARFIRYSPAGDILWDVSHSDVNGGLLPNALSVWFGDNDRIYGSVESARTEFDPEVIPKESLWFGAC